MISGMRLTHICKTFSGCKSISYTASFHKDKRKNYNQEGSEDIDRNSIEATEDKYPPKRIYDATGRAESLWNNENYPSHSDYKRSQAKFSFRPDNLDSKDTSIVLFPGQGTQYVGMGKRLIQYPHVKEMYEAASEILGYDLYKVSVEGPKEKLNKTVYQQPAIYVASLAAVQKLKAENAALVENCIGTAGFSLGEISALTFAGSFSFEDGVRLIKVRAEAMQYASELTPGGMMTAFLTHKSKLKLAITTAKTYIQKSAREDIDEFNEHDNIYDCRIASYLHPDCKVVAGNIKALEFLELNKELFEIERFKPLAVSGAFHTSLMKPAVEPFTEVLQNIHIQTPQVAVMRNIDGKPYLSANNIRNWLPDQMIKPVRWEQIMHSFYERKPGVSFPNTFICGPGMSLKLILAQINKKASEFCNVIKS